MENFKQNTLIEIPIDTVAQWTKDAQEGSMSAYGYVSSRFIEIYLDLKTEGWRMAERLRAEMNQELKELKSKLREADKKIEEQEIAIDRLKGQIK